MRPFLKASRIKSSKAYAYSFKKFSNNLGSDGSAYYRKQRKNIKTSLDHVSSLLGYSHAE